MTFVALSALTMSASGTPIALQLIGTVKLDPISYATVYTDAIVSVAGQTFESCWSVRAPQLAKTPSKRFDKRTTIPVAANAQMTIEPKGFKSTYRIWTNEGKLRNTFELAGLSQPTVYSLDHIVLSDRSEWLLKGKTVRFPVPTIGVSSYQFLLPNESRVTVCAVNNWKEGSSAPSDLRTWMAVWEPQKNWRQVVPPAGFRSLIPVQVQPNGWISVRLTNSKLNSDLHYSLSGYMMTRLGPVIPEGQVRFWREGTFTGETPAQLPVPKKASDPPVIQQHFALGKWGPLELYETHAFTLLERDDKDFFATAQLRWRLNGVWRSTRDLLPSLGTKTDGMRYLRESGGYLFLETKDQKDIHIVKVPTEWLR